MISKTLTVNGLADDEAAIWGYARDLRASGRFAPVVMTDMHGEEQRPAFTLTLME